MLRTTRKMRDKYEDIQICLFDLIPEKWEEIYLYASVVNKSKDGQSGEMFFYYFPKGILKKKPVNVYEVPKKFNINETEYLKVVESLYKIIKDLKQDFVDTEQELWTNITISIAHCRFKIEFYYDEIKAEERESYIRHVIWRYKYLHLGGETKEERKIIDEYLEKAEKERKEEYKIGMYLKTVNNVVGFDREIQVAQEKEEEKKLKAKELEEKKNKKRLEREKKAEEKKNNEMKKNKNQILKM